MSRKRQTSRVAQKQDKEMAKLALKSLQQFTEREAIKIIKKTAMCDTSQAEQILYELIDTGLVVEATPWSYKICLE